MQSCRQPGRGPSVQLQSIGPSQRISAAAKSLRYIFAEDTSVSSLGSLAAQADATSASSKCQELQSVLRPLLNFSSGAASRNFELAFQSVVHQESLSDFA